MSIKSIVKHILPVSMYRNDRQYEMLKKQNDKIIELLKAEQKTQKKHNQQVLKILRSQNGDLNRIERLLEMEGMGVTEKKRSPQIIVTVTSYGDRISVLPLVLERITHQSVKPDRIIVYLSKDNFPHMEKDLPERLLDMLLMGVEIRWCDGDIRSYKKIVPPLQEFPDDILITIDDDLYYELDMVEKLYESYKKHPNAVSALRVHRMTFDEEGQLKPYAEWDKTYNELVDEPNMSLFPTTGAGTLFPPHILPEEVLNEKSFLNVCPHADDIWVKFMAVMADVKTVLVEPYAGLKYVAGTQEDRLWEINKFENDKQIQDMLSIYNDMGEGTKTLLERIREDEVTE